MATTYAIANAGSNNAGPTTAPATQSVHLTIIGWIVLLAALYMWNRTRTGHELIFYGMVLIVLFLFVGNYARILPVLTKQAATSGQNGGTAP